MRAEWAWMIAQTYQRRGQHALAWIWRDHAARLDLRERIEADRRVVG